MHFALWCTAQSCSLPSCSVFFRPMLVGNGAEGKEIEVPYYLLPLKNVNTCFTLVLTYSTFLFSAVLCVCTYREMNLKIRQNTIRTRSWDNRLIHQASDVPSIIFFHKILKKILSFFITLQK